MDPPQLPQNASVQDATDNTSERRPSSSQLSSDSQTAAEFIDSQLQLEADAREALPYSFDTCTQPLGALRQILFSCLTCNPAPSDPSEEYQPAAVCYSCSISCHGEHTLVELFNKRNFTCDCGTTRYPSTSPCSLRINPETNTKGGVHSEPPAPGNKYNHNFKNRFCACECDYDAYKEKGTMFQCLGLGTAEDGGCGEDWWHPGCVLGLGPTYPQAKKQSNKDDKHDHEIKDQLDSVAEVVEPIAEAKDGANISTDAVNVGEPSAEEDEEDVPLPPGFPQEDDFNGFICYKCVDANPWIKRYAGTMGFLQPVFRRSTAPSPEADLDLKAAVAQMDGISEVNTESNRESNTNKRKAEDDQADTTVKRVKGDDGGVQESSNKELSEDDTQKAPIDCKYQVLPPAPTESLSLFFKDDFRDHLCRCSKCFPELSKHPHLLEEEESYEPPVSDEGDNEGGSTVGSGSLLDRGERALSNVDRVRAIEGVMAYNHLKDKLKPFFQQFAESGQAISAEDIKAHFAKLRGDEEAIRQAGEGAANGGDNRKEQSGY